MTTKRALALLALAAAMLAAKLASENFYQAGVLKDQLRLIPQRTQTGLFSE